MSNLAMSTLVIIGLALLIIFWRPPFRLSRKLIITLMIILIAGLLWLGRHTQSSSIPTTRSNSADQLQKTLLNKSDF